MERKLGPYIIEERLASGGMAEVFVAHREGSHGFKKRVALKRILPQLAKDPDFVTMFIDEARLAARLEHPNIVQVFDFGEYDGELVLAMELVVGTHVGRLIRATRARNEHVPIEETLLIVSQAAHALAHAHRVRDDMGKSLGVVHRDVSPANLLLAGTGHLKLSDFGIARAKNKTAVTDGGHVRGKMGYMSPEQVLAQPLDGKSDVFTLATVFAELLTGSPLFGEDHDIDVLLRIRDADTSALYQSTRRIPRDVLNALHSGLRPKPQDRPSASEFAESIDELVRKRGGRSSATRLARLLQRYDLVRELRGEGGGAPSARPTPVSLMHGAAEETEKVDVNGGQPPPDTYRVELQKGIIRGPMSFPQVVELLTAGEIGGATFVAKDGDDFRRVAAVAEFSRFVTSPAFQWRPQDVGDAKRRGSVARGALLRVVHDIAAHRETGVLHLIDGEKQKKIYFIEGRPDYVASTDKSELLGEYLVSARLCLRMEVDMALALLSKYDGRLGDALVGLGILRPMELFRAVREQVRSRYLEAFRWTQGEWAFIPFATSDEDTVPLAIDNEELLRDAAQQTNPATLRALLAPMSARRITRNPEPPMPLSSYRVPAGWARLLDFANQTTVGDIIEKGVANRELSEEEVHRAVYLGISCRLLEFPDIVERAP